MDNSVILKQIGQAKAMLVISNPFIASIVCAMPLIIDDTIEPPTLQTNSEWVKVHPQWVADHSGAELQWALAHETFHCVFMHMIRSTNSARNPRKWNIAGDVVINTLLETDRIGQRPKGVIWEPHPILGGLSAQALYAKGGGTTDGVYALLPDPPEDAGSGGAGDDGANAGQWDNCETLKGDSSVQSEAQARMQIKVSQAAAAAKMCGKLSANMERFVDDCLKPKVNWTEQLRHFFTKRARVEQSYARPNRRFMSQGLYMPGKSGNTMGDILVAIDLSGSVAQAELNEFVTELKAIKTDCMPSTTHIIYFAERVLRHDQFTQDEELEINANGSGGTAFSPIFAYADKHNIEPAACVVLTDLYCSDFGPPPPYPVMWASTGRHQAPWGEVIMLRREGRA